MSECCMIPHGLKDRPVADEATRTGLALLPAQFGTRAAPGVEMAVRVLAGGTRGEDGIRDLCVAYTRTLVRAAGASSAVEPPS